MITRRDCIGDRGPTGQEHAGLWLDKYILNAGRDEQNWNESGAGRGETSRQKLVVEVAGLQTPAGYPDYYARWKGALDETHAEQHTARVSSRMVVGLGDESVLEASVALHQTWGVPCIPGTALKGLAAHYADREIEGTEWRKGVGRAHTALFGTTEDSGCVTFYDALWVPPVGARSCPLAPDIMTVHHPEYYQGDKPPADWDNPTPIPFLTATGEYLIALGGPPEWVRAAFEILALSLERMGIGAKTAAGYGRMTLPLPWKPSLVGAATSAPATSPGSAPRSPAPAAPAPPLAWRTAIIRELRSEKPTGLLEDIETQEKLRFPKEAIEDKARFPGKKDRVEYATEEREGGRVVVRVRKATGAAK